MTAKLKSLQEIAQSKHGYFTAHQAFLCGFRGNLQFYHLKSHHWQKIYHGLFRLPNYPDCMESDFTKWCLWSRNQQDQPQGVISYQSALALHGFVDYNPKEVHLTVPARFRKEIPNEIIIHKASLPISAIESRGSFMVTRLGQTLLDMRQKLKANGEWEGIIEKVVAEGKLSREEMASLGLVASPKASSESALESEVFHEKPIAEVFGRSDAQMVALSGKPSAFDPVSEGVWKMMYDRAEFGRRASKAGFTLVELLVVVAIISIIAGLLLPVLGKAKEAARQMQCLNNVRQLGAAFNLYADDNRDYYTYIYETTWGCSYPTSSYPSTKGIQPYIGYFADDNNYRHSPNNIYRCPNMSFNVTYYYISYGYNYYLGYGAAGANSRRSSHRSPSKTMILVERGWENSTTTSGYPWYAECPYTDTKRLYAYDLGRANHGGKGNSTVFIDNHVKLYTEDIPGDPYDPFFDKK